MLLRRFRRQYEQLSQFERGRIIGMMEAGWSARRVVHQLGRSDCVVRRCWDQCVTTHATAPRSHFSTRQCSASHSKVVTRLSLHCYYIFLALGRRVGYPTSLNELEARLWQIWNEISQDIIQNLYASMPDRIASCIRAREGSTGH
ncbi:uncharacterized protein TNCV_4820001 [Trichonephila clavipes]|nr:uncharacterized protein TNCV_4820001 [Trichonephila clavipes]